MVNSLCQPITGLRAYLLCLPCPSTGCRHKVTPQKILINWQRGCFSKGYSRDKGKGRLSSGSGKRFAWFSGAGCEVWKRKKKRRNNTPIFISENCSLSYSVCFICTHTITMTIITKDLKKCARIPSQKSLWERIIVIPWALCLKSRYPTGIKNTPPWLSNFFRNSSLWFKTSERYPLWWSGCFIF